MHDVCGNNSSIVNNVRRETLMCKQTLITATLVVSLTGCLALPEPAVYDSYDFEPVSRTFKIDSSVADYVIREQVIRGLNYPTSISKKYHFDKSDLVGEMELGRGETSGIQKSYNVQGAEVIALNNEILQYNYYDGRYDHDSRAEKFGNGVYSHDFSGAYTKTRLNLKIVKDGNFKSVTVTSEPKAQNRVEQAVLIERPLQPLSKEELLTDISARINNIHLSIPEYQKYDGETKLTNDVEAAFASIQRNYRQSLLSTNTKTDSAKSGTFQLPTGQKVNFKLVPYLGDAKLQYDFTYAYFIDGKGESSFDSKYKGETSKLIVAGFLN